MILATLASSPFVPPMPVGPSQMRKRERERERLDNITVNHHCLCCFIEYPPMMHQFPMASPGTGKVLSMLTIMELKICIPSSK